MKRRNKKAIGTINCGSQSFKGAARSDQMLTAGLMIIILASIVVIGKTVHTWKGQFKGEKEFSRDANIQNLQAQINALKKEVVKDKTGLTTAATNTTAAVQKESTSQTPATAFEKAVNDKDFTKVEALMATRIFYVIDASDCCGDITKKEAAANLKNYIRSVKSFDFDQNQQVVKQMKVNLADTFAKYTIGIADNRMVLSYHLDAQGKVDDLMLSASHLMYDLE
jgi:hypothetical protein